MLDLTADQQLLLDVLNSTPVTDGIPADLLRADAGWFARAGGVESATERRRVVAVRDDLQAVVRGTQPASVLASALRGVHLEPALDEQITWTLHASPDRALAARLVIAWDELEQQAPGRLRPCANDECRLFLFDRSKTNNGRWCSMAICGNRMKARRHYQKTRPAD